MNNTLTFMRRAMELAEQARGLCSPNPFVGAVIVKQGKIIGEGWTQAYGSDHAEVQAIKNSQEDCRGADLYVTLEPCSHYGKTPPCANAIIAAGIKSVFIGITDPNPLVSGQGIKLLEAAGIEVQSGFMADEISIQLEYYLTYITKQRPFVILKTAVSTDGRIAAPDGSSRWISGTESRRRTHELRQEVDAVLTGIGTVSKDDPLLNVRLEEPRKQPLRVVLDTRLNFPLDSQIAKTAASQPTLIFTAKEIANPEKSAALAELGIEIVRVNTHDNLLDLVEVLSELHQRKISVILVEAGSHVNTSFLKAGLADKLIMFIAPRLLGGSHLSWHQIGVENITQALNLTHLQTEPSGNDLMLTAYPDYSSRVNEPLR